MEFKDIQQLIEDRATRRLNGDLASLQQAIKSNKLLSREPSITPMLNYTVGEKQEKNRLYWLLDDGTPFYNELKKHWLPEYITEESKAFLQKVDQIQEDVKHLMDNQPEERDY